MSGNRKDEEESPMYVLLVLAGAFLLALLLIWMVASHKIVLGSLKPALAAASMWKLIASDFTYSQWNIVVDAVQRFNYNPTDVSPVQWMSFISTAFRPLGAVAAVGYLTFLVMAGLRRKPELKRRITADSLMRQSVEHFTGIAPVVAIRKQIVSDKHPLWRVQVSPEEVFLSWKVPRTKAPDTGSLAKPGMPMLRDGKFDREVARAYFIGAQELLPDGRLVSAMLGRQVVNLTKDAVRAKSVVFADRLSSEGKTLLALWAAVAFGGVQGRDEYCDYRDRLNRSAFGTKDGIANLALAQPLYEKYRKHPLLNKLFSIHHWEHTFLFALLALAQKKGRFTTAEVLWLRPLNRVMFFALNTRGSYTPHTEAASTFAQHAYETACAKLNRLPLMQASNGVLTHVIYVDKAVDGLELECMRWLDADADDDDDWWQKKDVWAKASPTILNAAAAVDRSVPDRPMPGVASDDTEFDRQVSAAAQEKQAAASLAATTTLDDDFTAFLGASAAKGVS